MNIPYRASTIRSVLQAHAKPLTNLLPVVAAALFCVVQIPALAATYSWDADGVGAGTGGSGNWDTASSLWDNGGLTTWPASGTDNDAVFGGTAGTVSLTTGISANDLTFNTTGYLIQNNTLTLNGATPTATVGSGLSATINSLVAGSAGLVKSGAGTFTLGGNNTYTGGTTVTDGILLLAGANNGSSRVGPGMLTIQSGATVRASQDNVLGYDSGAVTPEVTLDGGTFDFQGFAGSFKSLTMNGGTLTRSSSFWYFNQAGTISVTGGTPVISGGTMNLRPAGGALMPINVVSGATLTIS